MNIHEYQDAMVNTLEYWLNIHTKAEAWAEVWVENDICYSFTISRGYLSNDYFNFNWAKSALKIWAKENRHLFTVCSCGIYENGYRDCEHIGRTPTIAQLIEYLVDHDHEHIACMVGDYILEQALVTEGFKTYRQALRPFTRSVEVEIKDVLRQIDKAKNPDDLLAALAWANHVNHVHGNIAKDYGDRFDLDYDLVCQISQEGIGNVFNLEEN